MSWRLGVDIGGTFTDVVLAEEGGARLAVVKVSTTPRDFARGMLDALGTAIEDHGLAPADVRFLAHAATVVTNALLEGKGARTALSPRGASATSSSCAAPRGPRSTTSSRTPPRCWCLATIAWRSRSGSTPRAPS